MTFFGAECRFKNYLEHICLIAVCFDTAGNIIFCNDFFLELTGWQREEVMGKQWMDLVFPREDSDFWVLLIEDLKHGEISRQFEKQVLTRSGARITVAWNNTMLCNRKGENIGFTSIGVDITSHNNANREVALYQQQLKELMSELAIAEERERRRISTELHDGVGQNLALTRMRLKSLSHSCKVPEHCTIFNDIIASLDSSISELRSLTFQLSPPLLYEVGFEAAVEWLCDQLRDHHGLMVQVHGPEQPLQLPEELAVTLYQIVRELFANVVKHAQACQLKICLKRKSREIHVTIEDDGMGFDVSRACRMSHGEGGFGIFNIRQRLQYLKGELQVRSQEGSGTMVFFRVPLQQLKIEHT